MPSDDKTWAERRVGVLKGVGPELERKLARLGIHTIGDLIRHYPRRYDDFSAIIPISAMRPGPVTFRGRIERIASRRSASWRRGRRLTITEAIIADHTGTIKAVWFNQPYLVKNFPTGSEVLISGKLEFRNSQLALQSPSVERVETAHETESGQVAGRPAYAKASVGRHTGRIVPVYPETEGLSSKQLRALIEPLLPMMQHQPETLPADIVQSAGLMAKGEALPEIHYPSSAEKLALARRRLAFEELWLLILASLSIKHDIQTEAAPQIKFDAARARDFVSALPFELTDAQRQAAWQILQDLEKDRPMNRLLEGDVGSGKTVVALLASVMALHNGFQAVLMVPTEILARQHLAKARAVLEPLGYRVVLVAGGQKAKEKAAAKAELAPLRPSSGPSARPALIIGTHALLTGDVEFTNLGLVIIDEQHRFGVEQRLALKAKAGRLPHLLSMTATPIPRSLALTVYGDLDISIIDQLPPGRKPVTTKIVKPKEREATYAQVDAEIAAGRQVFVVCPIIEESDVLGVRSATAEAERLKADVFAHRRIELLHGKLKPAEKQAIMDKFVAGEVDILVATSVIEVGVDVPNASVMLIEGADRFGLAALHQLRGRVGRGGHQAFCFLLTDAYSPGVAERLKALAQTTDGFRLAQIDLELRGPGQIYGRAQHGELDLELADIADAKLVAEVRQYAQEFLAHPGALDQNAAIKKEVNRLKAVTSLD